MNSFVVAIYRSFFNKQFSQSLLIDITEIIYCPAPTQILNNKLKIKQQQTTSETNEKFKETPLSEKFPVVLLVFIFFRLLFMSF